MDRLTERLANGVIKRVEVSDGNRGDRVMSRLAAYEDTGLTPQEIKSMQEWHDFRDSRDCISADRLRALAEADRDGRCVVLPCPFYSEVYALSQVGNEIIHGELRSTNKDYCLIVNLEGNLTSKGKTWHGVQVRMQDVFPTRPEAEAAQAGEGGQ